MRVSSGTCRLAVGLTVTLLLARLVAVPPLADPAGGIVPPGVGLAAPPLYLLLAPLFTMWDGVALLSRSRMEGFLLGLVLAFAAWRVVRRCCRRRALLSATLREVGAGVAMLVALVAFVLGGALWHRPMLSLSGLPASLMSVDFHTHTSASRDVRGTLVGWYDLEANRRWHDAGGYDAAFITDHNRRTLSAPSVGADGLPVLCPGTEIGAWRAHVLVLGRNAPAKRPVHGRDLDGLFRLLRETRAAGAPAVLSIPEYEHEHRDRIGELLASGAAALEISNGSPKASELTGARRDTVIGIARAHDAAVLGVSDHHGWGATAMTWSLVARPEGTDGHELCATAVQAVASGGFGAVQIVERHRVTPDAWWPALLTPAAVVWETWRAMGWPLTLAWLFWIWGLALVSVRARARSSLRPIRTVAVPLAEPVAPAD